MTVSARKTHKSPSPRYEESSLQSAPIRAKSNVDRDLATFKGNIKYI